MRVEITTHEAMSTGTFTEVAPGIYRSEETGEVLIVGQDGRTAVTVTP